MKNVLVGMALGAVLTFVLPVRADSDLYLLHAVEHQVLPVLRSIAKAQWQQVYWQKRQALAVERCGAE